MNLPFYLPCRRDRAQGFPLQKALWVQERKSRRSAVHKPKEGDIKIVNGVQYRFNKNHRWERVKPSKAPQPAVKKPPKQALGVGTPVTWEDYPKEYEGYPDQIERFKRTLKGVVVRVEGDKVWVQRREQRGRQIVQYSTPIVIARDRLKASRSKHTTPFLGKGETALRHAAEVFEAVQQPAYASIANALLYQLTSGNAKISTPALQFLQTADAAALWEAMQAIARTVPDASQWGDIRRALDRYVGGSSKPPQPQLLANALNRYYHREGIAPLLGMAIRSPQDVAAICKSYSRTYETLNYVFVRNGKLVGITGVSSRLPGATASVPSNMDTTDVVTYLRNLVAAYQADAVYLHHNHPSGNPAPSEDDIDLTQEVARALPEFKAHVITDHADYAILTYRNGTIDKHFAALPFYQGQTLPYQAKMPHPLLGRIITDPDELAATLRDYSDLDCPVLIGRTARTGAICGLMKLPNPSRYSFEALRKIVNNFQRATGARDTLLGNVSESEWQQFATKPQVIQSQLFLDVVTPTGRSLLDLVSPDETAMGGHMQLPAAQVERVLPTANDPLPPLRVPHPLRPEVPLDLRDPQQMRQYLFEMAQQRMAAGGLEIIHNQQRYTLRSPESLRLEGDAIIARPLPNLDIVLTPNELDWMARHNGFPYTPFTRRRIEQHLHPPLPVPDLERGVLTPEDVPLEGGDTTVQAAILDALGLSVFPDYVDLPQREVVLPSGDRYRATLYPLKNGNIASVNSRYYYWRRLPSDTAELDYLTVRGQAKRQAANDEAVALLQRGGPYTPAELRVLANYSGRGNIGRSDASTNEYYTPPAIAQFMWNLLAQWGFQGGTVLEPGCGTGVFLHTAKHRSDVLPVGVEIDSTSAEIARTLNPHATVVNQRLERYFLDNPEQVFDAVIGNVPFGSRIATEDTAANLFGKEWKDLDALFVAKSLERLRPEGLMAVIVPTRVTEAAKMEKLRRFIVSQGRVLGVYRLPNTAFRHSDSTVVTDILLIQRHPDAILNAIASGDTATLQAVSDPRFVAGKYFEDHPENMLGTPEVTKGQFGRTVTVVKGDYKAGIAAAPPLQPTVTYPATVSPHQELQVGDVRYVNGRRYRLNENHRWERDDEEPTAPPPATPVVDSAHLHQTFNNLTALLAIAPEDLATYLSQAQGIDSPYPVVDVLQLGIAASEGETHPAKRRKLAFAGRLAYLIWWAQRSPQALDDTTQQTLLRLLQQYRDEFGSPTGDRDLLALCDRYPQFCAFTGAFRDDGAISDQFLSPEKVNQENVHQKGYKDVADALVTAYLHHNRPLSVEELQSYLPDTPDLETQLLLDPRVALVLTPEGDRYTPATQYYRGDGYQLLDQLQLAQMGAPPDSPRYQKLQQQIEELHRRLPPPRALEDINLKFKQVGTYFSVDMLNAFLREELGIVVQQSPFEEVDEFSGEKVERIKWMFKSVTGSAGRFPVFLVNYLNNEAIRAGNQTQDIYREIALLEQKFRDWLAGSEWRSEVEEEYNRRFNCLLNTEYSDAPLAIEGIDKPPDWLNWYNRQAVRQLAEQGRGILAHGVGLGKTPTALCLAMYLKQLGKATKTAIVVPKSVLANWVREIQDWCPRAKVQVLGMSQVFYADGSPAWELPGYEIVLKNGNPVIDSEGNWRVRQLAYAETEAELQALTAQGFKVRKTDKKTGRTELALDTTLPFKQIQKEGTYLFTEDSPAVKKAKLQQTAQNSYDIVLMSEPQFQAIPCDPRYEFAKFQEIAARHIKPTTANKKEYYRLKDLAQRREQELAARKLEQIETEVVQWEQLGIDCLIHDEAHHLRNLFTPTGRYQSVGGLSLQPSKRSLDFWLKAEWVREHNAGQNVYLLTATPTVNNPLEVFNMLMHVAPEEFDRMGIRTIDDFLEAFGDIREQNVFNLAGELVPKQLLMGFQSLNDLRNLFHHCVRLRTAQDVQLPLPQKVEEIHEITLTPAQQQAYAMLRARAKAMLDKSKGRAAATTSEDDHIFSVLSDMDKVTIDLDYYNATTTRGDTVDSDGRSPKIEECIKTAVQSYHGKGGGQIIFCDAVQLHEKIRQGLIAAGIPAREIAIVNANTTPTASDRQRISNQFNLGTIRIVIGNTATMGEGINLQRTCTDIHELDIPWTPAAIEQRLGRGIRQGNPNKTVVVHRYHAKGSIDPYRAQIVDRKAGWITALWQGTADTSENPEATGGLNFEDLQVLLADDPEAARQALEAQRIQQAQRLERQRKSFALNRYRRLQNLQNTLAKLEAAAKPDQEKIEKTRAQIADLRRSLESDPYFEHKAVLNQTPLPDLIDIGNGEVLQPKMIVRLPREGQNSEFVAQVQGIENGKVKLAVFGYRYNDDPENEWSPYVLETKVAIEKVRNGLLKPVDEQSLTLNFDRSIDYSFLRQLPLAVLQAHRQELEDHLLRRSPYEAWVVDDAGVMHKGYQAGMQVVWPEPSRRELVWRNYFRLKQRGDDYAAERLVEEFGLDPNSEEYRTLAAQWMEEARAQLSPEQLAQTNQLQQLKSRVPPLYRDRLNSLLSYSERGLPWSSAMQDAAAFILRNFGGSAEPQAAPQTEEVATYLKSLATRLASALQHLRSLDEDNAQLANGVGFAKGHGEIGRSLLAWVEAGKAWSPRQLLAAFKIASYYRNTQLAQFDLPSLEEVNQRVNGLTQQQVAAALGYDSNAPGGTIQYLPKQQRFVVKFPKDEALIERIRQIPGRQWHPELRCWSVPLTAGETLLESFREFELQNPDEALTALSQNQRSPHGHVEKQGNKLFVQFNYDPQRVAALKAVPAARRWDAERKRWEVEYTPEAIRYLQEHFPEFSFDLSKTLQKAALLADYAQQYSFALAINPLH